VAVSLSRGAQYALELARLAPQRIAGAAFVGFLPMEDGNERESSGRSCR
jgi:pimeloyl-ACP methyl ester carboxylesterase